MNQNTRMETVASFICTDKELLLVNQIIKRAREENVINNSERQHYIMNLIAANANGCPIDFEKLLNAPPFDFKHDIYGIEKNIDKKTGEIKNCFLPRCSK